MTVNELRVGNYILFKSFGEGKGKIGAMKKGDFGRFNDEEYHPIPLTPEWLERCGFVNSEIMPSYKLHMAVRPYQTATQGIFPGEWQVTLIDTVPHLLGNSIRFLHQLQNLYFALTGEDLNVRL